MVRLHQGNPWVPNLPCHHVARVVLSVQQALEDQYHRRLPLSPVLKIGFHIFAAFSTDTLNRWGCFQLTSSP